MRKVVCRWGYVFLEVLVKYIEKRVSGAVIRASKQNSSSSTNP